MLHAAAEGSVPLHVPIAGFDSAVTDVPHVSGSGPAGAAHEHVCMLPCSCEPARTTAC